MEKNSQSWLILLFVHGFDSKTVSTRSVYQRNPHLLRKTHLSFFDKIREKPPYV